MTARRAQMQEAPILPPSPAARTLEPVPVSRHSMLPCFAGPGRSNAFANAVRDAEVASLAEEEMVSRARRDVRQGLVYTHDHVRRLCASEWRRGPHEASQSVAKNILWTLTADMAHLVDGARELDLHCALEQLVASASGSVYTVCDKSDYRLHVGKLRVRFELQGSRLVVLAVVSVP